MEFRIFDLLGNKKLHELRVTLTDIEQEYAYPESVNLITHKLSQSIADQLRFELSSLVVKSRDQFDSSYRFQTEYSATFAIHTRREWTQLIDAANDMANEIEHLNKRIKLLESELRTIEATAKIAIAK